MSGQENHEVGANVSARMISAQMISTQIFVEDVELGLELPVVVRRASRVQLFLYSAATWNPHRIHYDAAYAQTEGHPDVIVHGPLQGAWLGQYVTDWAGPLGRVIHLSWQNRASALPERDYEFHGRVIAVDGDEVQLDVREQDTDGTVLMPAAATVRLPRRIARSGS